MIFLCNFLLWFSFIISPFMHSVPYLWYYQSDIIWLASSDSFSFSNILYQAFRKWCLGFSIKTVLISLLSKLLCNLLKAFFLVNKMLINIAHSVLDKMVVKEAIRSCNNKVSCTNFELFRGGYFSNLFGTDIYVKLMWVVMHILSLNWLISYDKFWVRFFEVFSKHQKHAVSYVGRGQGVFVS